MNEDNIFVAISMITYNQEDYIAQAIDSILMQKTNFSFKLFISDDNSSDGTSLICKDYIEKFSEVINFERLAENKGAIQNWNYNLKKCRDSGARYVAICEGDDYWTDPLKLQKQVDFLETNEDVNLVHTDIDWLNVKDGTIIKNYYQSINYELENFYDLKQYLLKPKARTLTICFRSDCLTGYHEIIDPDWSVGDTPLLLYVVKDKKIGFINESTGVYRRSE